MLTHQFKPVQTFTLRNRQGRAVSLCNVGAAVCSIQSPDRHGRFANIVLGYAKPADYLNSPIRPYFGATIGRVANRVAGSSYRLGGKTYRLVANNGGHSLHGGRLGFDRRLWKARPFSGRGYRGVAFNLVSEHLDQGHPGRLRVTVSYRLGDDNTLGIEFKAQSDRPTHVNMTHHSYFNLCGEGREDVLGHQLWINADRYTPVNRRSIPTGKILAVGGTPLDFRSPKAVSDGLRGRHAQIKICGGYDHNYVLNKNINRGFSLAATLLEPRSGRGMELWTDEPGLQFYSGNQLDGRIRGKSGRAYGKYAGLCLEPQHFPDSPNQKHFPSTLLKPGEIYRSRSMFRFFTME